jgi:hypothetical protein
MRGPAAGLPVESAVLRPPRAPVRKRRGLGAPLGGPVPRSRLAWPLLPSAPWRMRRGHVVRCLWRWPWQPPSWGRPFWRPAPWGCPWPPWSRAWTLCLPSQSFLCLASVRSAWCPRLAKHLGTMRLGRCGDPLWTPLMGAGLECRGRLVSAATGGGELRCCDLPCSSYGASPAAAKFGASNRAMQPNSARCGPGGAQLGSGRAFRDLRAVRPCGPAAAVPRA